MKAFVLYDYPPSPGGLATQGDLLYKGLLHLGVEAKAAHFESPHEKEWYYRWFQPDVVIGVGYWGHTPHLVLHPQRFGMTAVPWFVADGYVADHHQVLNELPLILVTSNWVRETYIRDGVRGDNIEVLPVGCDMDNFIPREPEDPQIRSMRQLLGVGDDELMILTVGGDAASKGAQEVMQALAMIGPDAPPWKYVCKVWPQPRTTQQNAEDLALAQQLGIDQNVVYANAVVSRNFMPFLLAACDIYAAPSRLEGFGMTQVEANACGKPVVAIDAMAFRDTMVHGETALLAGVGQEIVIREGDLHQEPEAAAPGRIAFDAPRVADYRANVQDLSDHLLRLMQDRALRESMGAAGRRRVAERYDYRRVAAQCVEVLERCVPGFR